MRKAFISYARANKPVIDQLVEHLNDLGCQTWVDSSLHGGQDWWQEILHRIEDCDVFIAIISNEALTSLACEREFDWAEALGKPVLPVAVEPPPTALPRRYSRRQIVDYSEPADWDRAARRLGGALLSLPPAPPPTRPLPRPPAAPLSYLTDLVEMVSARQALTHDQQRQVLVKLEPALRSVDPAERRGGRAVLERFSSRADLYADVDRTIYVLKQLNDEASRAHSAESRREPAAFVGRPVQPPKLNSAQRAPHGARPNPATASQPRLHPFTGVSGPIPANYAQPHPERSLNSSLRQLDLRLPATLIALAAITGAIPPIQALSTDYHYDDIQIWYWQTVSRILIGLSFCMLAWKLKSLPNKYVMVIGLLIVPIILLHVINDIMVIGAIRSGDQVNDFLPNIAYPTLLALASLVGVAFGAAVIAAERVAWASILIVWGLCGLVEAILSYIAKIDTTTAPRADSVLIVQNVILLTVAVLMYRESRATKT